MPRLDKDRNALDIQHLLQPADERVEQRIKGSGRGKRAAKIEQAVSQIVSFAVEHSIDLFLEKGFNRTGNHHDRCHREDDHDYA